MRVVARLGNSVLREAVAEDNGAGAILDVADLAAPSVVEACLARTTHTISAAGVEFVISGAVVPRDATLRGSTAISHRWRSSTATSPATPATWWPVPAAISAFTRATGLR